MFHPYGNELPCRCGSEQGRLVRYIVRSGAVQVRFQCGACNEVQYFALPRTLTGDPNQYPVAIDRSDETSCIVCEHPGAELHHWAPRHIFGDDADRWPTGYLCIPHHQEWHRRMNVAMRLRHDAA